MQWLCGVFPYYSKGICIARIIYFTTSIIQSSMKTTIVAEAILNLNSNQLPWFHAPTSLYKVTNGYVKFNA